MQTFSIYICQMKAKFKKDFVASHEMVSKWVQLFGFGEDARNRVTALRRIESLACIQDCLVADDEREALASFGVEIDDHNYSLIPCRKLANAVREIYNDGPVTMEETYIILCRAYDLSQLAGSFERLRDFATWSKKIKNLIFVALNRDVKRGLVYEKDGFFISTGVTFVKKGREYPKKAKPEKVKKPKSLANQALGFLQAIRNDGGRVSRNGRTNSLVIDHNGTRVELPFSV